jgi:small subunit ribosomal protein S17
MAEEQEKDTPQDETEAQPESEAPAEPAAEAPAEPEAEASDAQPAAETPAESEAEAETPAGPEAETPAEPDAETPAEDAGEAHAAAQPSAPHDEEGPQTPKQQRKRERSRFKGDAPPQRSAGEKLGERAEVRSRKAQARSRWRRARREKERSARGSAAAEAPAAPAGRAHGERKVRQGVVVSSKADKTITVRIDLVRSHRVYGKVVRNSGTLHAHDERNQANEGDVVRVIECRPLSRTKRWRLLDVLEKAR